MKEFLRKIKLIDDWTTDIEIRKEDFVDKLSAITEEREIGLFSDAFIPYKSSQKEYAGHVGIEGFKIKRRGRWQSQNMATATGVFNENDGHLTIEMEINGFSSSMMLISASMLIVLIFSSAHSSLFSILIFTALIFFITYMVMRISMSRFFYDLEREFFYLTKK